MQRPPGIYRREVIYLSEHGRFEVVEITWDPQSYTPVHDHGKSHGLIVVVQGTLYERVYANGTCRLRIHPAGSMLFEHPKLIHMIGNSKGTPAKSRHFYYPKITMKTFDPDYINEAKLPS